MRAHEFLYKRQLDEDVENFPIANVRRPNGAIGNQGVNTNQAADVLTHAAGMQVSPDWTMRQMVDALKADPAAQQRLRQFVQQNPITVYALPDGTYHLQDGHHRTFLLNLLGDETVPAVVKEDVRVWEQDITEARKNPKQNVKFQSGKFQLVAAAENIRDKRNWGLSMTAEPKLGINPQAGISEDTPKGIYFYPLEYFIDTARRYESLPWGDNMPYMQLFQYDRSGEMTQQTQVDPAQLRQVLSQYCPEEVMQQVLDEPDSLYDDTPYWFIYDCLSRLGKSDETNIIRWNKVLRDLGFTSVFDPGRGWIAYGEPTQGVILDPRIIKQHRMFVNRNPTGLNWRYDINRLADAINWSDYYNSELQRQQVPYGHPDRQKIMLAVANTMLKPFLGKTKEEAKEMGLDQALKTASNKVIEILKQDAVREGVAEGLDAEAYKEHLIKTMPQMMKFLSKNVKGWRPSEEQMLSAIDTAYMVMKHTGDVKQAGKALQDELNTLHRMSQGQQGVAENFADGKNPGRKGLSKRMGVNTKASVSSLRKTAKHSSGEKARMAHWLANMKAGRAKAKRK